MLKLLTIVGARPQFIKAAAISHTIRDLYSGQIQEDILHTGQHYDDAMSARFFRELDIPAPRYNLGVGSGSHGAQTAAMLRGVEEVLLSEHYDAVLVYGDTNSTLAGALAAAKVNVPVMHVEAGLRSYNRAMPEELNRVLTDHASALLFAPTEAARENLCREGFAHDKVFLSGDVMLDNVRRYASSAILPDCYEGEQILLTLHRNLNTDDDKRLKAILSGVDMAAGRLGAKAMFAVHPRVAKAVESMMFDNIKPVPPLSYHETLAVLQKVRLVMTDSGGLQKESFFSGRPCVVLRTETEWTEIVDCGAAILAGGEERSIVAAAERMWSVKPVPPSQFGDGRAAEQIVASILHHYHNESML